ncbi:nitronate monooxygenase family protein [Mesorhizobium sp. M2C.T.Ca.TU.002.02.1.1]|uniref:NAD(P)H-dependent flavin oxidoreductase n=1 Tax=Mesorhizobium sp. M2C.T.Ca.TU.002.02.1.1 TaxID=2496788 RepID=UPI000FCB9E3A|nr:nitronate monooxygenase family protein [Mesorhizobium sp. M2C.T.Ca.TU.002.02.1.1]RUU56449.1 nitronate monooxygenase [Mesorhizobium sp. M2C.T.Ca.TU.002.02.1.1]
MPIPDALLTRLRLPVIAAPMFLVSGPDLVVEVCRSGVIGAFPALNQRSSEGFSAWLEEISGRLADIGDAAAPFAVNLIVHRSNPRLAADLDIVARHKVPLVITSLGAVRDVVDTVHAYGGFAFHDVINIRHAEKAAQAGVDGIIAVSAGAGGHAGATNPFALLSEIRSFFSGTLVLSGSLATGRDIAAARVMGADLAYMGTRFIATSESMAPAAYKNMIVASSSADILYTPAISGVNANFLRPSIVAAGLDPDHLPAHAELDLNHEARAWKAIWSAGQGVGAVTDVPPAAALCERLAHEYRDAMAAAGSDRFQAQLTSCDRSVHA